jgi:poly(hydroxyalkanoate) granule-associated protein
MAAKKKGKLGGAGASGADKEKDILYTAQQIWQAGLGALAKAQAGAPRVFDDLMREGGKLQGGALDAAQNAVMQAFRGARQTVDRRVDTVKEQAGETWDNLEKIFQTRVQRALAQLDVPSAEEFAALKREVAALSAAAGRVSRTGGVKRSSRPARRRSKSS